MTRENSSKSSRFMTLPGVAEEIACATAQTLQPGPKRDAPGDQDRRSRTVEGLSG